MPRQALFKNLDPSRSLNIPAMRVLLEPDQREYQRLIIQDRLDASLDIKGALKIYKKYIHPITRQPTWGKVPLGCSCKVCFPNCVCRGTLLFASLFNAEICVPAECISTTISERKKCRTLRGTAGRKLMLIMEELLCYQKKIDSEVAFLEGTTPFKAYPAP